VKKVDWLYLLLILTGIMMSDVSWSRSYSHTHSYSSSVRSVHGYRSYPYRHYSSRPNFSLGIGVASSFGSYGHFGYSGRNIGIYGDFAYRNYYPVHRYPYTRPYYRPYGYLNSYYWPVYPPIIYPPPIVVVQPDPPVYIQQQPAQPTPSPGSTVTNYWYYCENPAGYYPEVEQCPGGWIKVPPRPAQ